MIERDTRVLEILDHQEQVPGREMAKFLIREAEKKNPGKWVQHSYHTAECAQQLAEGCIDMDPEKAYVLGLLHDYREKISYITQLMDPAGVLQRTEHLDLLVVQLSTNDGTMEIDLGSVNKEKDLESFDVSTSAGAMEYIIAYAEKKWHCPVMFYVNPYIHPEEYEMLDQKKQEEIYQGLVVKYEKLIALLYQIQEKWQIGVIDLWNEASFRSISMELKRYYMADIIHPYKSGYLFWYTPFICQKMEEMITA